VKSFNALLRYRSPDIYLSFRLGLIPWFSIDSSVAVTSPASIIKERKMAPFISSWDWS
jgi:hypothetical protein